MAAQVEIGGTAYAYVDGQQYNLRGSLKINTGGAVRTPVMGMDGNLHGYTVKYVAASADFEVSDSGTLSLETIRAFTGDTVTMELGNGKSYVFANAFQEGDIDLDAVEGKFTLKMTAAAIQELLAP